MILLKILAGLIFTLLGLFVLYKGIRVIRKKGIGESLIELVAGIVFVFLGLLIWLGYFS